MADDPGNPSRQFAAAWQAATAAVEAGRSVLSGDWHACRCQCGTAHPDDKGVCDGRAVLTRRVGQADTRLCAPCAVAQGVAEMPH